MRCILSVAPLLISRTCQLLLLLIIMIDFHYFYYCYFYLFSQVKSSQSKYNATDI